MNIPIVFLYNILYDDTLFTHDTYRYYSAYTYKSYIIYYIISTILLYLQWLQNKIIFLNNISGTNVSSIERFVLFRCRYNIT